MESRSTYAEINLDALTHNVSIVREKTGNKKILAVVKADAYGHGAAPVAKHLLKDGVSAFGVAFTHEAIELRESGISSPILVFFDRDNIDLCLQHNLIPTVFDFITAERYSAAAEKQNKQIPVHVKVDTGMGRIGYDFRDASSEITKIASLKNIKVEGLMSHFSEADLQNKENAYLQLEKFQSLVSDLRQMNINADILHIANSAAVLSMPEAHLDMVRPGIMLYGYGCCESERLRPVMSIKSRIVFLKKVPPGTPISYGGTFVTKRESTIATIPLGYADGYSRFHSNNGEVLINSKRAPVIGRVCMDTVMIDVTEIPDVSYSSEVVLLGHQGNEQITADDLAENIGTIPYEILTSVGQRVSRIYT